MKTLSIERIREIKQILNKAEYQMLVERIAAFEHNQWICWASSILESENLSKERKERWRKYLIPYEELNEDVKEHDRTWARAVLNAIINEVEKYG